MLLVEKITKLCKARGISIYKLEKDLPIGNGTIARWDKQDPGVSKLKAVADYFGVTVDYLLKEDE